MEQYKQEFIEFMVDSNVLKFGSFTLKSGRQSPFFMNAGSYVTGTQLRRLGGYYARAIHEEYGDDFDILFGPAYKGIPLGVATAMAYSELYGKDVRYSSNRKEAKDHGEGGAMVGYKPQDGDRIAIIEDVVTAGTAVRETIELFKQVADVKFSALFVSVDRMERGTRDCTTLDELRQDYGIQVYPIVTIRDIMDCLHNREVDGRVCIDDVMLGRMEDYLAQYGPKS